MADNLTNFMCRLSRNSGGLNLLEPSGPVQACNGIALPFFYLRLTLTKSAQRKKKCTQNFRHENRKGSTPHTKPRSVIKASLINKLIGFMWLSIALKRAKVCATGIAMVNRVCDHSMPRRQLADGGTACTCGRLLRMY
jgi:hypothetical protein